MNGAHWNSDSPWNRLPWTLPAALMIWVVVLWVFAFSMGKPALRPAEPPPIDAQLFEQCGPAAAEEIGPGQPGPSETFEPPQPVEKPPQNIVQPVPVKPQTHLVKQRLKPVVRRTADSQTHPKVQKEAEPSEQANPAQSESGGNQSERSTLSTGSGSGGSVASSGQGDGGGNGSGGGGGGLAERAFGSPDGPSFLHKVMPSYPPLAKKLEKEGIVLLRVTIDARGRPVEVEVLQKAGFGFDEEAVKAIKESTFTPAKRDGKALACRALLPIRFVLTRS